ncbi:hypothetical protein [Lentibacter sp. XHP0401]|uniref:hypothetical protein n=1 Tax=Lentibacter sp. XHP0401 TaxID=2984334 RepID=UPI0021E8ABE6|nr:hypothetical protein [Lentibacter sp. XHP0401]MCV2891661.1 hypothetical protein [Lentibacter sp. XHP0401]
MALLSNLPELAAQARDNLVRIPRAKRAAQAASEERSAPRQLASRIQEQLLIPTASEPPEESTRVRVQDKGQFLARQERWEELSRLIRAADNRKAATHCGMPHADLLSLGARTDVVLATEHAIADGFTPGLQGIEALEDVLAEFPDDYAIAEIVAQSHMDIGWSWRGSNWSHEIPERNLALFHAHFERASDILGCFSRTALASPLLAAAQCALVVAKPKPAMHIADAYERLIDLNPVNTAPMRSLGNFLLPRWFGTYDALELEARRTAARCSSVWGNGGYTWVFLDALRVDQGASRALDVDFFVDGLRDILYLQPDQHIANLLAAYTGITMSPARTPVEAPDVVRDVRREIHSMFDHILRENLRELHPLLWAEADLGPDLGTYLPPRGALLRKGRDTALNAIAIHFKSDIISGKILDFSKDGLTLSPQG